MKRLFTKYGTALLGLAAAIAVLLSVMTYFSSTSAAFPNLAGIIASPFRAAGAAITGKFTQWRDYLTEFDALKEENQRLREENQRLQEENRQAQRDREENERLYELLELRKKRRDLSWEPAAVVEGDTSNWASVLTVNRGTAHDVAVGDCVIDSTGYLVGVVTEAGLNWSEVRTVIDSDSSIGAMIYRSGDSAVAQGDFALMGQGMLRLAYLGGDADVAAGDLIVTSGLGGYYPSQLTIGYVEELHSGEDGLTQYAVVAPSTRLEDLTQVFIITDFDIVE